MRLTVKTIDDELRRLGHDVHIQKGDGYFYFWKGAANNWLDRTVNVSGKAPKKTPKKPKSTDAKP
jgi:hypothetical protein